MSKPACVTRTRIQGTRQQSSTSSNWVKHIRCVSSSHGSWEAVVPSCSVTLPVCGRLLSVLLFDASLRHRFGFSASVVSTGLCSEWMCLSKLQVLSDPNLKKLYDSGKDLSQDTDFMASGEFFAMLFGSTRFDEFVGELMISTVARSGEQDFDRAKVSTCAPHGAKDSSTWISCHVLCRAVLTDVIVAFCFTSLLRRFYRNDLDTWRRGLRGLGFCVYVGDFRPLCEAT
jgi:hypothetical protein